MSTKVSICAIVQFSKEKSRRCQTFELNCSLPLMPFRSKFWCRKEEAEEEEYGKKQQKMAGKGACQGKGRSKANGIGIESEDIDNNDNENETENDIYCLP